jgi:hypothetical protein
LSKCSSPARSIDWFFFFFSRIGAGKNPRPTDETEYALAQLEILSADTASVFSDDVEPPSNPRSAWAVDDDDGRPPLESRSTTGRSSAPIRQGTGAASSSSAYRGFGSVRDGPRSGPLSCGMNRDDRTEAARRGSLLHGRVTELRPSSRRTRRFSSGDVDVRSETDSESDASAPATSYRRRASPLSSQELEVASVLSGLEPTISIEKSPLSDPAFQKDLLQALDNLRKLIAAVDHPRSIDGQWQGMMPRLSASCHDGGKRTITRRSSRLMRRLESQLTRALPVERPRRDASASSSSSSSSASSSRRGGPRARAHHCRPLQGGTPFVVCDECKEILQLPAALPVGRASRLKCGGCGEAFEVTLPASGSGSRDRPNRIFSAPQPAAGGGEDTETEYARAWSSLSGEQPGQVGPLHRVLGYSSVSSVLRSQRYGDRS